MTSPLVVTNVRTAATLELAIEAESLQPQDSGSRESAEVSFDLYDTGLTFDLLPEDEITVSAVGAPSDLLFGGFVRMLDTDISGLGRKYSVTAFDYSTLLDRINVVSVDRPAGESDHDRLAFFMTTFGSGLLDDDPAGIATLNASMPAQKFRLLSLRQAIEQVLGSALQTGTYRLNAYKKLETWDTSPGLSAAPFDVIVGTPGAGQIAPEAISIKGDTGNLYNAIYVRGATAAGSGWFTNPTSIASWGRREKYIDAPDSDLAWKAYNVGMGALADTDQPKYRGTMTLAQGDWRSDQRFALTSAAHDLTAAPFDTAAVSRRYLNGQGIEVFDVQFGSPKKSFLAKHGKEARRADGVGPGSGGWGPGGGFGGGGGGPTDCGCGPMEACTTTAIDDLSNRTLHSTGAWAAHSNAFGASSGGFGTWTIEDNLGFYGKTGDFVDITASVATFHRAARVLTNSSSWFTKLAPTTTGTAPWENPFHTGKLRFKVNRVGTGAGALIGHGVTFDVGNGLMHIGIDSSLGEVRLFSDTTVDVQSRTVWTTGAWYIAELEVNFPAGYVRGRVYLESVGPTMGWDVTAAASSFSVIPGVTPFYSVGGWNNDTGASFETQWTLTDVEVCPSPGLGQAVLPEASLGDGVTTSFVTKFPYGAGSLQLVANGSDITSSVTETDPASGRYDVAHPLPVGTVIIRRYLGVS